MLDRMSHPPPLPADTLLDLLVDTVCVVDAYGRFVYLSASVEALLGYTPDELLGTYMIELVHPDDRGRTLLTVADIMAGSPVCRFENRYLHKDGTPVRLQWAARWSAEHQLRIAAARRVVDSDAARG
jgi:PAS domain S-box-containing protein